MNDLTDEAIRNALRAETDRLGTASPSWDDVVRRAGRGRARRTATPAVAAALVLLALVAGVVLRSGSDPVTEVTTDPAPFDDGPDPAPPVPGRTVGPLDLPAGAPLPSEQMVALTLVPTDAGDETDFVELVTMDRSGEIVRRLLPGEPTHEGGLYNVTLSPDRRTVFVARATSACDGVVLAVAADGSGQPQELGAGNGAVLSTDRSLLALDPRSSCQPENEIELIPVAGGSATRYGGTSGRPLDGLSDDRSLETMAFAGDGQLLYIAADRLWLLDSSSGEQRELTPGGSDATYVQVASRGDGTVDLVSRFGGATNDVEVGIADTESLLVSEPVDGPVDQGALTRWGIVRIFARGASDLIVGDVVVRSDVLEVVATDPEWAAAAGAGGDDQLSADEVARAQDAVTGFLAAFDGGDLPGAAALWSGYPVVASDDDGAKQQRLARLRAEADWPTGGAVRFVVHPAWSFGEADAMVTAVFADAPDRPLTFLVAVGTDTPDGPIQRLPDAVADSSPSPAPTSSIEAGSTITIPGVPVEGGARAFLDDEEIPLGIDHDAMHIVVTIPPGTSGPVVLMLTTATPEQPGVQSWAFTVD